MNRRNTLKSLALAIAGSAAGKGLLAAQTNEQPSKDGCLEFAWNTFKGRRSVRKFKPDPVPAGHISTMIDMARTAPTSGNQQPWKFVVTQDRKIIDAWRDAHIEQRMAELKKRKKLAAEKIESQRKGITQYYTDYFSAPVYITVLTDNESEYPDYNVHDGPLAAGYLLLAARFLGYGTVYATDSFDPEVTKMILDIPLQYEFVCCTPVGIPDHWPDRPPKKNLDEFIVRESF